MRSLRTFRRAAWPALSALALVWLAPHGLAALPELDREDNRELQAARMAELETLIGQWSLRGLEHDAEGALRRAEGTRTCRWALGGTAIRCDEQVALEAAAAGPGSRDSLFYLSFNTDNGLYELTLIDAEWPQARVVPVSFDAEENRLQATLGWADPGYSTEPAREWTQILGPELVQERVSTVEEPRDVIREVLLERRGAPSRPVMHF